MQEKGNREESMQSPEEHNVVVARVYPSTETAEGKHAVQPRHSVLLRMGLCTLFLIQI